MNDECCKFFNTHKKVNRETESAAAATVAAVVSSAAQSERTETTVGRSSCAPMFTSDLLLLNSATFRLFSEQGFSRVFYTDVRRKYLRSLEVMLVCGTRRGRVINELVEHRNFLIFSRCWNANFTLSQDVSMVTEKFFFRSVLPETFRISTLYMHHIHKTHGLTLVLE